MDITVNPEIMVVVTFFDEKRYTGKLKDLPAWVKENNAVQPKDCKTSEGKHGIYPILFATTPQIQAVLSFQMGYQVDMFEGVCFKNLNQLKPIVNGLRKAKLPIPSGTYRWGVTEHAYVEPIKAPQRELQLTQAQEESPFL